MACSTYCSPRTNLSKNFCKPIAWKFTRTFDSPQSSAKVEFVELPKKEFTNASRFPLSSSTWIFFFLQYASNSTSNNSDLRTIWKIECIQSLFSCSWTQFKKKRFGIGTHELCVYALYYLFCNCSASDDPTRIGGFFKPPSEAIYRLRLWRTIPFSRVDSCLIPPFAQSPVTVHCHVWSALKIDVWRARRKTWRDAYHMLPLITEAHVFRHQVILSRFEHYY